MAGSGHLFLTVGSLVKNQPSSDTAAALPLTISSQSEASRSSSSYELLLSATNSLMVGPPVTMLATGVVWTCRLSMAISCDASTPVRAVKATRSPTPGKNPGTGRLTARSAPAHLMSSPCASQWSVTARNVPSLPNV